MTDPTVTLTRLSVIGRKKLVLRFAPRANRPLPFTAA